MGFWPMFIVLPLFKELSKNKKNGTRPIFINRKVKSIIYSKNEYKEKKKLCAEIIRHKLDKEHTSFAKKDILLISAHCILTDNRTDSQNFIDAICDILQEATGVNDKNFMIGNWTWERKTTKKKENLKEKKLQTTSTEALILLKLKKLNLEESLSTNLMNNFTSNLTSQEKIELAQMIQD